LNADHPTFFLIFIKLIYGDGLSEVKKSW